MAIEPQTPILSGVGEIARAWDATPPVKQRAAKARIALAWLPGVDAPCDDRGPGKPESTGS